ncbi:dTMP kinase [Candidatus Laterigemmans baculatus]|uniref:dTMP kinase n=1 Tax=Candidatus Laterigemmans baculatus TaxID=2770505 RepID=UPI00193BB193|nr:dTMP kinase [Candidatus Laterigemmans baculatus]
MFIAFDGIDGAGKSTQITRLVEALQAAGRDVVSVRDPGSTAAGEAIRALVLDSDLEMHRRCEALLYMAARSQLVEERIRPALAAGQIVVSDRYLLANVVYQSAGGGEAAELLWQLGEVAISGVRPDLTVLLDLPADVALSRLDRPADRMEARGVEYLTAVREGFRKQLPRASQRTLIVDAAQSIEAMAEAIRTAVFALAEPTTDQPPQ